jgi:SAM-dependent methyltransferase
MTQTYLPVPQNIKVFRHLFARDYEYLYDPLAVKYHYERVGFDRLLAIINDLEMMSLYPPASILDVGCNTGLFAVGLANMGYQVTGVDNNMAADVQGFYPEKILDIAGQLKNELELENLNFIDTDIETFLAHSPAGFDVCLLLSVVHQWFAGYAVTGIGLKSQNEIEKILQKIASRTNRLIYYEGPQAEHPVYNRHIALLDWFFSAAGARRITLLSNSVSAEGDLRALYRIEL